MQIPQTTGGQLCSDILSHEKQGDSARHRGMKNKLRTHLYLLKGMRPWTIYLSPVNLVSSSIFKI
jgi:hypothetical protein